MVAEVAILCGFNASACWFGFMSNGLMQPAEGDTLNRVRTGTTQTELLVTIKKKKIYFRYVRNPLL